ncbi:MAG: class I SAM-dependent methyltransferase [Thermoleophilaceae bacterium]
MPAGWEDRASQWLAWARTPGHDAYWRYRDAFLALVPPPAGRTLEVGCGEGRVTRDLAARGHAVTALDASPTLVAAAAERDPEGTYLVATPATCRSTTPARPRGRLQRAPGRAGHAPCGR